MGQALLLVLEIEQWGMGKTKNWPQGACILEMKKGQKWSTVSEGVGVACGMELYLRPRN